MIIGHGGGHMYVVFTIVRPCLLIVNKENKFMEDFLKIFLHLLLITYITSTFWIVFLYLQLTMNENVINKVNMKV